MLFKTWNMSMDDIRNAYKNAHIRSVNFWVTMVLFNPDLLRKVEFYEYEMLLDVEIVAPFMLLHNSKFNNF